ncbi:Zinc transporter 7 [Termitomyces sp. J132]|nr:Zinc transporter 7 [Termitomyces sp. J132]
MPVPDARTRNKISLNPTTVLSTIPSKHIPNILLSNVLVAFSIFAAKEWLLDLGVGVFWVVMRVLACGGLGVLVWEGLTGQMAKRKTIEWSVLGMASLLMFLKYAALFTALFRLSSKRQSHPFYSFFGFVDEYFVEDDFDTRLFSTNSVHVLTGYGALTIHALSTSALDSTLGILSPSLGSTFTIALTTLGASVFALPFYLFRMVLLGFPTDPVLPLMSLASIPLIAYALLFFAPITSRSLAHLSIAAILGVLAFTQSPSWSDLSVAVCLYTGMFPENTDTFATPPRTPTARLLKAYLKTILSNRESRKIFYFLCLNMCYMMIQMLYGVWTNSLGLISDAIHMAFDCMAIGVGLFASVMATWEPNERFTYGYGRIETLSGFANGIFLILISIFIVFEAIQRILDPPEMNTSQLLLGGHSHSHGHGHSHASDDKHSKVAPATSVHSHSHSHSHSHDHAQDHSHSHSHSPPPSAPPVLSRPRAQSHHAHSHSHSYFMSPTIPGHDHAHSHSHSHARSHSQVEPHEGHSDNMRGVFLHVMADTLGSVGVIISTLLIQFYGWTGFDPIASLFIAILIAASVIPLVLDTGKILALDLSYKDTAVHEALEQVSVTKLFHLMSLTTQCNSFCPSKVSHLTRNRDFGRKTHQP